MKKLLLLLFTVTLGLNLNAQSDCSSAQSIGDGTFTVSSVNGTAPTTNCAGYDPAQLPPNAGVWYEYTNNGNQDLLVTVSSDLQANAGGDTKLSILEGSCTNLSCVANNDDVNFVAPNDPNNNLLSEVEFLAEVGESYLIVFDATWDPSGFDFVVSSTTNVPGQPDAAINPDPADGSTVFLSQGTDPDGNPVNEYLFTWDLPNTSEAASSYTFDIGEDNTVSSFSTETSSASILLSGLQLSSTYFWRITSTNAGGSTVGSVWSFTTESTLSNTEIEAEKILEHFVSNNTLSIKANNQIDHVEIYNMLGQAVHTVQPKSNSSNIALNTLSSGMFIAKVTIEGQTQTFKFVK